MESLYSNLPAAKTDDSKGGTESWNGPPSLTPLVARKKELPTPVVGNKKRHVSLVAYDSTDGPETPDPEPVLAAKPEPPPKRQVTNVVKYPEANPEDPDSFQSPSAIPSPPTGSQEYNPAQPNDYEDCLKERRLKNVSRKHDEEMERRKREMLQYDEREGLTPLELSGDDAWRRRAILSGRSPDEIPDADPDPDVPEEKKLTPAEQMMMKMGWKGEGSGIGKNADGIATPLMHRKIGQSTGQIVQAPPKPMAPKPKPQPIAPPTKKPTKRLRGRPCEVIMLRNMVGPGEVDDDLCKETEEECQEKYGGVQECKVHEVKDGEVTPQEAVRIFVRFSSIENAVKAAVDLDGRLFAGRTVCACFYDTRRYENGDLAPGPNEPELPPEIMT
jgi:splicing factor 45|uniref:G-patch domain-containing protein n=1 Tax=Eutreptiella gymnastica TaxID=73025 RepID=A0A7S4LEF6_9EUGL